MSCDLKMIQWACIGWGQPCNGDCCLEGLRDPQMSWYVYLQGGWSLRVSPSGVESVLTLFPWEVRETTINQDLNVQRRWNFGFSPISVEHVFNTAPMRGWETIINQDLNVQKVKLWDQPYWGWTLIPWDVERSIINQDLHVQRRWRFGFSPIKVKPVIDTASMSRWETIMSRTCRVDEVCEQPNWGRVNSQLWWDSRQLCELPATTSWATMDFLYNLSQG